MKDPIVEEVRTARQAHVAQFNFKLHDICNDLKKKEKECGCTVVKLSPKKYLQATGS